MRTSTKKEHAADQRQWTPDDMDFRRPFDDIPIGTANRTQRDFQIFFDSLSAQERAEIRARCAVIGSDQRFIEWARDVLRESGADAGQQGETNFAQPEIWQPQGTAMERVTRKIVRIERPFRLGEENNPAGDYEVTTYEEPLGDLMYDAFRQISTKIYLPPTGRRVGIGQFVEIDPQQLEDLVMRRKDVDS
jgi:hypothetical protein